MIIHTEYLTPTQYTFCCDLCGSDFEVKFANSLGLSGIYYVVGSDLVVCNCLGCNRTYEIQRVRLVDGKEHVAVVKYWDDYAI